MKKTILLIPLAAALSAECSAQSIGPSTLNASGGSAIIAGTDFGWSVGEMTMVSTFTTAGIIVTQGLLQPAEKSTTGVTTRFLATQLQVFPNPASSVVHIQYVSQQEAVLTYKLTDMTGRVIRNESLAVSKGTTTNQVNVSELACATYMLEVLIDNGNSREHNSYKIQKIK